MRLGKIYKLEKKHEMAWAAWSAGIEVGQKESLTRTTKYEVCGICLNLVSLDYSLTRTLAATLQDSRTITQTLLSKRPYGVTNRVD